MSVIRGPCFNGETGSRVTIGQLARSSDIVMLINDDGAPCHSLMSTWNSDFVLSPNYDFRASR